MSIAGLPSVEILIKQSEALRKLKDETCPNCPCNNGREELCYSCFKKKLEKHRIIKESIEKFGI